MISLFLAFAGFMSTVYWGGFGSILQKFLSTYRRQLNVIMALLLVYSAITILIEIRPHLERSR